VAAVVLATAVRLSIVALSGSEAPYATFYLAIIITVCLAGRGPAILATLLGGLAADYFFIESPETFAFWHPRNALWAVTYLIVSATLIAAIEAQRKFRARAESALAKLQKDEERLRRQAILLNLSHDAIIRADANGVVTGWNAGAREMYGISSEQAV
jgi:K+-sensing histidine kinase KdpD